MRNGNSIHECGLSKIISCIHSMAFKHGRVMAFKHGRATAFQHSMVMAVKSLF